MRQLLIAALGALVIGLVGCDDGSGGSTPIRLDAMVRVVDGEDSTVQDDAETTMNADSGGSEDGGMVTPDEGMGNPILPPVDTCEQICALYERCDRLDIWPGRSIGACQEACEAASDIENFSRYQLCLQTTTCERLQDCRLPQRPRATCAQVCEAVSECGADARIPGQLDAFDDCDSACGTPTVAADIRQCGEAYVAEPETCDEGQFALCFLRERYPECTQICERRVECSAEDDIVDCAIACANEPVLEDPIAQRRARSLALCAQEAVDCAAFEACERPAGAEVDPLAIEGLCGADAMCGFFGDDCPPRAEFLLGVTDASAEDCLAGQFMDRCEESPLPCITPRLPTEADCTEFCAVTAICDRLPEGEIELECRERCNAAVASGDLAAINPYRLQTRCAYVGTCDEYDGCLNGASTDEVTCEDHCRTRAGCGGPEEAACLAECEARSGTLRLWAEKTCTAAAGTCEASARCIPEPPPPCAALCELRDACNEDPGCARRCDDEDYRAPGQFASRYACLVSTDNCAARAVCDTGDESGGFACLNWCRNRLDCAGEEGDLLTCLQECGQGIPGRDGLVFETANACLRGAGDAAECDAIALCIEAAQPVEQCDEFCAEQARCGLIADAPACEARCREAIETPEMIDELQCVLSAVRRQAGCAAVAECVGAEVEPASELCSAFCATQAECNRDLDVFLCERECTPEPEGLPVRNACLGFADCEAGEFPRCVDADGEIPMACVAACETVSMCAGLVGADADALFDDVNTCQIECAGRALLLEPDYLMGLGACVDAAMCDGEAVAACMSGAPAVDCGAGWDAIVACNNLPLLMASGINDRAGYIMVCEQQYQMDPQMTEMQLACLIDVAAMANGNPLACLNQIGCVIGGLGP